MQRNTDYMNEKQNKKFELTRTRRGRIRKIEKNKKEEGNIMEEERDKQ